MSSGGSDRLQLQLQCDTATLQLNVPVQVVVTAPPHELDQLLWNGQELKADITRPGTYLVGALSLRKDRGSWVAPVVLVKTVGCRMRCSMRCRRTDQQP